MRFAIVGCTHGAIDRVYEAVDALTATEERKVDAVLCCGDFQSVRNLLDLKCMACPDRHKELGDFYHYYSSAKKAKYLTIFIGGNHEASNYLQELPFGGFVAPNIYYLGFAGVVNVVKGDSKARVAGLSGIFSGSDFRRGRYEASPYPDEGAKRSVYHTRQIDVFRLKQLIDRPPDVVLSHDWPGKIFAHGDTQRLIRRKPHFEQQIGNGLLGSMASQDLLEKLKPEFWFAAHMHVKFPAVFEHRDGKVTKFLALDKPLPGRHYLQIVDVGDDHQGQEVRLEHDAAWLAVLKATDHLVSTGRSDCYMPGPGSGDEYDFRPSDDDIERVKDAMNGKFHVGIFEKGPEAHDPEIKFQGREIVNALNRVSMPPPIRNGQTTSLCEKLGIRDPLDVLIKGQFANAKAPKPIKNADEIDLDDDEEDEDESANTVEEAPRKTSLRLPEPVNEVSEHFVIDNEPEKSNGEDENAQVEDVVVVKAKKTLKRRNRAIYDTEED